MSTDLATTDRNELANDITYARAIAPADMLPEHYRDQPANVLVAVGLGRAMGLTPAESLYRIHVIKGTPSASAELIATNVRKAGHKLRVELDEANQTATCTIIRADDPDFAHTVTRDLAWAKRMKLDRNDNYTKQPLTMLQWRAITACARLACPEALYGVAHTADELADLPTVTAEVITPDQAPAADRLRAAIGTPQSSGPAEPPAESAPATGATPSSTVEATETAGPETDTSIGVGEGGGSDGHGVSAPTPDKKLDSRSALARDMFAALAAAGIDTPADALRNVSDIVKREITRSGELTEADARAVILKLDQRGAES